MHSTSARPLRRALISVSDKSGLKEFARFLVAHGVEIISTGGSAQVLRASNIAVTEVSDYTGFAEIMDGRVKTLHPRIYGGILARRGVDDATLSAHDILPIDLVVVNLYPFARTVAERDCTFADAMEHIDIGGAALLRAAAKNHEAVVVIVERTDYKVVCDEIKMHGAVCTATRKRLAALAFSCCARYDRAIAEYLNAPGQSHAHTEVDNDETGNKPAVTDKSADESTNESTDNNESASLQSFPELCTPRFTRICTLRYGENPHQRAALYGAGDVQPGDIASATLHQGKALSYNNLVDADSAWRCVHAFASAACVIVKHANPCGVACASSLHDAYQSAWRCDPTSAFGGVIAFNRALDAVTATAVLAQQFVEVLVAPRIEEDALQILMAKPAVRVLDCGGALEEGRDMQVQNLSGGLLMQDADAFELDIRTCRVPSHRQPSDAERTDALFAWKVAKYVKSNAIVYARGEATLGIGAGQMSRVDAARLGADKARCAEHALCSAVLASDAFLPFRDTVDIAAEHGVSCIIEPGGSARDDEVIQSADAHNIALLFTGVRHFRH